jgi:hypothetical protein
MLISMKRWRWVSVAKGLLLCWLMVAAAGTRGEGLRLESVGLRGGLSETESGRDFNQGELTLNANLPWRWDLGRKWSAQSRLDLSLGWLGDRMVNGAIGTLGPSLVVGRASLPVSLEGGVSPTLLSQHDYVVKDFGVKFQFTSHVGLNWDINRHVRLGYRFQHMSNAGLSSHNPGLNLHMIGVSYLF